MNTHPLFWTNAKLAAYSDKTGFTSVFASLATFQLATFAFLTTHLKINGVITLKVLKSHHHKLISHCISSI